MNVPIQRTLTIKNWLKFFEHSDILFRFQRILFIQAKACKDLSHSIMHRETYQHNKRFKPAFANLKLSLEKLR